MEGGGYSSNNRVTGGEREQLVMGRAVSWQDLSEGFKKQTNKQKKKTKRGIRGTERRERKGSKKTKQGQYTQRNVVLQTVELAKLKCTVTMGTLGEREEKKRLTMKYRKKAETICTFKLNVMFV